MNFSRPFGTWLIRVLFPTLKRWAIVVQSLRDVNRDVYPIGYKQASVKPIPRWSRHNRIVLLSCTPSEELSVDPGIRKDLIPTAG